MRCQHEMDHDGYGGFSSVTSAAAAASAVSAASAVDASFRSALDNGSPPFPGLVSISGPHQQNRSCAGEAVTDQMQGSLFLYVLASRIEDWWPYPRLNSSFGNSSPPSSSSSIIPIPYKFQISYEIASDEEGWVDPEERSRLLSSGTEAFDVEQEIVHFHGCTHGVDLSSPVGGTGIAAAAFDIPLGSCVVNVDSRFLGLVSVGVSESRHVCCLRLTCSIWIEHISSEFSFPLLIWGQILQIADSKCEYKGAGRVFLLRGNGEAANAIRF
ncbi:hypothetical protein GQ457_08G012990 [Hibiscus cannabinus]